MRRSDPRLIFGNWKMQLSPGDAVALAKKVAAAKIPAGVQVGVFPSFDAIAEVRSAMGKAPVILGAQDCHWETRGAYTGEESAENLRSLGCTHVLVGHSERRMYQGETDEMVGKKLVAALGVGLAPVLCIGEQDDERMNGSWPAVLERQLTAALHGVDPSGSARLVVAYEPVWAISTQGGRACAPGDARDAHALIRSTLIERFGTDRAARHFRLIYGGSVDPKNIASYLAEEGVEGALVGGASQKAASFLSLIDAAAS